MGYAVVKWDNKDEQPGKWGEYRIDGKFDLISVDSADDGGVADKLFGSALGMFGLSSTDAPADDGTKQQLDCFLEFSPVNPENKLALWVEVFDEGFGQKGVANEETKGFYRGAIRYREAGATAVAIVELNKLPTDSKFLVISARPYSGLKLKDFESASLTIKTVDHEIPQLTFDSETLEKKFTAAGNNEGFIFWIFARFRGKKDTEDRWIAIKPGSAPFAPGRGYDSILAVSAQLEKAKLKRDTDKAFAKDNVDLLEKIKETIIQSGAEQKAKAEIKRQIDEMAKKFEATFLKQGKAPAVAKAMAQKYATLQFGKVQGERYQKVMKTRLIQYVKSGKPVPEATALAKKDALDIVTFGGNKAKFLEEAQADMAKVEEAQTEAKKKAEEEYKNSFAGQAFGFFGAEDDEEETKPKSKKKAKPEATASKKS